MRSITLLLALLLPLAGCLDSATAYEWIHLKGAGAMHSSTGVAVSAAEMLRIAPPEALRWLVLKPQPQRHIDFDPGLGDGFQRLAGRGADARALLPAPPRAASPALRPLRANCRQPGRQG